LDIQPNSSPQGPTERIDVGSTYPLKVVSEGHVTQLHLLCVFQFHWREVGRRGGNWRNKAPHEDCFLHVITCIFAKRTFPSMTFQRR